MIGLKYIKKTFGFDSPIMKRESAKRRTLPIGLSRIAKDKRNEKLDRK